MAIFVIKVLCVLYWRDDGAFIELSCVKKYFDIMIFIPSYGECFVMSICLYVQTD